MPHTARRLATTVVAGLAVLALGAAPALAETQKHQDPRGDVKIVDITKAKPPKAGIDLVKVEATYKGGTLDLSMSAVKLLKKGFGAAWEIRTEDGTYELLYDYTGDQPEVEFFGIPSGTARGVRGLLRRGDDTCPSAKAKIKGDEVVGSVPRSCLGGADEVRIATLAIQPIGTTGRFKVDDGRQKGFNLMDGPKFGPKLEHN